MLTAHLAGLPLEEALLALIGGVGAALLLGLKTFSNRIRGIHPSTRRREREGTREGLPAPLGRAAHGPSTSTTARPVTSADDRPTSSS
jgi:hypothetical protein